MKLNKSGCALKKCFLCKHCLPEWSSAINSNKTCLAFKKNQVIFSENEPVKGIYFLQSGLVKVHKKWGDEKELILRFAKDGDILGHRGLGTNLVYPISATTLANTNICFIPLDFFYATTKVNNEFLLKLMLFFADELQESEKRMHDLAHSSISHRVTSTLKFLNKKFGTDEEGFINFSISKQDIASYVGATYESIFKILNELVSNDLIELDGKRIKPKFN